MKINGNTIRPGNVLQHNNRLWVVTKIAHVKPGKGGAFAQVEMRDVKDGTKLNERFRSSESVERVILSERQANFLYRDGDKLIFMDAKSFDQLEIPADLLGDQVKFLQDNMAVVINSYESSPISVQLPDTVTVEVLEADAVVKGQTASSSYNPAVVTGGIKVMVPPHIDAGSKIIIKPDDQTYVERAKD